MGEIVLRRDGSRLNGLPVGVGDAFGVGVADDVALGVAVGSSFSLPKTALSVALGVASERILIGFFDPTMYETPATKIKRRRINGTRRGF